MRFSWARLFAVVAACGCLGCFSASGQQVNPDLLSGLRYRALGPMGNRADAIAGEPGNPQVDYIGAASGGIFKTTNGGRAWFPIFDGEPAQSIGALAVSRSHPNIVWAGTGEAFYARPSTAIGDGIYKSADGGAHWTHMGLDDSGRIARIVINPVNPDIVFAAVVGSGFAPSEDRGVYRTLDGGQTWKRVLSVNADTGASDIAMDPNDPNTLLAGMWELSIHTWDLDSGGPGSGLYLSHDGGASWTQLQGRGLWSGPVGKIAVAIAPSDGKRMYALAQAGAENAHPGFFRSDDGGATWKLINRNDEICERAPYYTRFAVDPRDPDRIYFVSVSLLVSTDGGYTESPIPTGGDNHDLWIDPTDPGRVMVADDAGASITLDRGQGGRDDWQTVSLPIAQVVHVAADDAIPYFVYGSEQDSSSFRIPSQMLGAGVGARAEIAVGGCESGFALPDTTDNQIVYAGCYGGGLDRFDLRTMQTRDIRVWPDAAYGWPPSGVKYRWNWTFPIAISPNNQNQVYVGSQFVHETTNGGESWRAISPDLTRNVSTHEGDSGGASRDNIFAFDGATLWSLAESPRMKGLIWAGSNDGMVHVTRNGGITWTDVTARIPGLPPWATISSVEPSHTQAGTAYLSADDHMQGDNAPLIYRTRDFGATWTAIGAGIPPSVFSYVNCVQEDPARPGMLYAATENGVYFSLDDGRNWNPLQANLPHAPAAWLAVQPRFGDLIVATFGRGVWVMDDIGPLRQLTPQVLAAPATLFVPRPAYRFRAEGGYLRQPSLPGWQAPPPGADINYFLHSPASSVSLEVRDATGHVLRTLPGATAAGINRVPWDLREMSAQAPLLWNPPPDAPWVSTPAAGRPLRSWDLDFSRNGPMAPPGTYVLRLIVDGKPVGVEQSLQVLKDPNSAGTQDDIVAQVAFSRKLRDGMDATAQLIGRLEVIRRDARQRAVASATAKATATSLDRAALAIESGLFDVHLTGAREDQFRNPDQLWAQWSTLNHEITDDSADFAPTAQQKEALTRLTTALAKSQANFTRFTTIELAAFNAVLARQHLAAVTVPADPQVPYAP